MDEKRENLTENIQAYQKKYRQEYKKRNSRVGVTLTNEEFDYFETLSKNLGVSIPKTIVFMALRDENVDRKPLSLEDKEFLKDFIREIRYIGNNINQIAYNLNLEALQDASGVTQKTKSEEILNGIFKGLQNIENKVTNMVTGKKQL